MNCPECKSKLEDQNINIQKDIAKCAVCGHVFTISQNIGAVRHDDFDINETVKGTWIHQERGVLTLGASTRSPMALFMVPFMLVWSGGSIGGIYISQIMKGEFNLMMSLFGIPFLLGSIFFWGMTFMFIWGKVELRLDREGGSILTGIGKIGYRQKFKWADVSHVEENQGFYSRGSQNSTISLLGKKRTSFGIGLRSSRRYYLFKALESILPKAKANRNFR